MKIYLDLLLIQNTFFIFIQLLLFNKILNLKIKIVRMITVSLITSILLIIMLILKSELSNNLIVNFFVSILVIKFGMKVNIKNEIILKTTVLWIITVLLGGINVLSDCNVINTSVLFFILGVIIIKLDSKKKRKLFLEAATCFIEFKHQNKLYNLKALVDTGHSVKTLYDEDVIFIKNNLIDIKGGDVTKNRKVSYRTVSGINQINGIKICNINISYGNKKIKNNAVIVSTPNISDNFDAIVSLNLVEGGCTYGNINFNERKSKEILS